MGKSRKSARNEHIQRLEEELKKLEAKCVEENPVRCLKGFHDRFPTEECSCSLWFHDLKSYKKNRERLARLKRWRRWNDFVSMILSWFTGQKGGETQSAKQKLLGLIKSPLAFLSSALGVCYFAIKIYTHFYEKPKIRMDVSDKSVFVNDTIWIKNDSKNIFQKLELTADGRAIQKGEIDTFLTFFEPGIVRLELSSSSINLRPHEVRITVKNRKADDIELTIVNLSEGPYQVGTSLEFEANVVNVEDFVWIFGDGVERNKNEKTVQWSFDEPGEYVITLKDYDQHSDLQPIRIIDPSHNAIFSSNQELTEAISLLLDPNSTTETKESIKKRFENDIANAGVYFGEVTYSQFILELEMGMLSSYNVTLIERDERNFISRVVFEN